MKRFNLHRVNLHPRLLATAVAMLFLLAASAFPIDVDKTVNTPRFILHIQEDRSDPGAENNSIDIAQFAIKVLDGAHDELQSALQSDLNQKVVLRFVSPETFRQVTGAPAWTSAMYYRGEISVPYTPKSPIKLQDLQQTLRHEYLHAVTADLSGFRCPAWLDEGLAQMIEGKVNPALYPALERWMKRHDPLPLRDMQRGFTKLDRDLVPIAYAESLLAGQFIVKKYGWTPIVKYLQALKDRKDDDTAFSEAFGKSLEQFQGELFVEMRNWAHARA